ncbi:MAG: hypothetical protein U0441_21335 [Polyangiaceae bacterium]
MKLDRAAIVLRPRTVSEICDLAMRLTFSLALPVYGKLAAITLLPIFLGAAALRKFARWEWFYIWLVVFAAASLAQGVFTVAAGRLIFAEDLRVREVLGAFGRRLFSYIGALIASRFLLAIATLPIISLPFAWVALLFVHEASLLEGAGPAQACTRASRFVRGRGGEAFALLLMMLIAQTAGLLIGEVVGQSVLDDVFQAGKPFGSLWEDHGSPFAVVGFLLTVPVVATARFLSYIDTRTRADGWDIQVRFLGIASKDSNDRRLAA